MTGNPSSDVSWTVREYPVGPLLLAASATGLVTVAFHARDAVLARALDRLADRFAAAPVEAPEQPLLAATADQLDEYFAGARRVFDLPLDWALVSAFHARVLRTLFDTVPFGAVVEYGELARRVGEPGAARAVGVAMGANPLPVIVPCHRVVASGGGIGGFSGGLETKRTLLALEGVLPEPLFP
ncbi:methylated-DNA--[protein]-cysteine S-methyltransferase [Streptomyces alkaliterrae]|uniref:Methylated-DNA--protein-cysteine methyltransferase n=1 Tax=Streptomyces alkaliterrae TaxID=2213162 RepID=A0A5P0YP15_9ACTN|nr:methylated-DNA--[protein]-cysteine S-methyltransferase [Streptomyces alkaliterrae]MBB1254909.1 methylated-DNA--[protein]-cysteine S-methyltransferase [Streptomyces alkaliterrae]MBB1259155.1 methylated-DNA--[protein]-cysteine S-methyltransferase [Streptomyces alkaliterrae]MQS02066.1 methylated-DNA--[protein]-cysteine S-methyltransferase [Streptomyces alkaliterrae]